MVALTTATKIIEYGRNDAELETWIDSLTVTTVYGFTATPLSNTVVRYTLLYA